MGILACGFTAGTVAVADQPACHDNRMPELGHRSADQPEPAEPPQVRDPPKRMAEERAAIRSAMDRAATDPAFALPPEQESELKRAQTMSPAEAARYEPPSARDTGRYATDLDTGLTRSDRPATPRAAMRDVPGLPVVTSHEAAHYLATANLDQRPWLRPAAHASPEAKRVIAAVDQGDGHHLQRHEGAAAGDAARSRVERLHDPANPDAASRGRADDGILTDPDTGAPRRHRCNAEATAISDPDAFAAAVAGSSQHPVVKDALTRPYDPDDKPGQVSLPIAEVLGPNGHLFCEGYRLTPIDGSLDRAMANRAEWVKAQRDGTPTDATGPRSEKIDTFEGGRITIFFKPRPDLTGYEIRTLYPESPDQ